MALPPIHVEQGAKGRFRDCDTVDRENVYNQLEMVNFHEFLINIKIFHHSNWFTRSYSSTIARHWSFDGASITKCQMRNAASSRDPCRHQKVCQLCINSGSSAMDARMSESLSESCFGRKKCSKSKFQRNAQGQGPGTFAHNRARCQSRKSYSPRSSRIQVCVSKLETPQKKKVETVHLHINKTQFCQQNDSKTEWDLGQKMRHVFLVFWAILLSCDMT